MTVDLGWMVSIKSSGLLMKIIYSIMSRDGDVDAPDMNMPYSNMESELGPALKHKVH